MSEKNNAKYIELNLISETLERSSSNPMVCYFIVNKSHDKEFIKKIALEFMEEGTWYHFYGKYEPDWHWIFDNTFIEKHPDFTDETIIMTLGYQDIEEFADDVYCTLKYQCASSTDVFVFYDDVAELEKMKELLVLIKQEDD